MHTHFAKAMLIVLAGLLFFASVSASPLRDDCGNIQVITNTVMMEKGQTKYVNFEIKNQSIDNFYIDTINVFDQSSGLMVSGAGFDEIIEGQDRGFVRVKVELLSDTDLNQGIGNVEVRGHFQSEKYCENTATPFTVRIQKNREQRNSYMDARACDKLTFNVPERDLVKGRDKVNFYARNELNELVTVRVQGVNTTVLTEEFTIGRNSEASLPVYFKVNDTAIQGGLIWSAHSASCVYPTQTTVLENLLFDEQTANLQETITVQIENAPSETTEGNETGNAETAVGNSEASTDTVNAQAVNAIEGTGIKQESTSDEPVTDPVTVALAVWNYNTILGVLMVVIIVGAVYWYRQKELTEKTE